MNGFLVIGIVCGGFDVPLGLFASRKGADYFADDVSEADVMDAVRKAWDGENPDGLVPRGVAIQPFKEGEPQTFEIVKTFAANH